MFSNPIILDKAAFSQHATITRPHSAFTESSFSLPTAYYEQTTHYFKKFTNLKNDMDDEEEESRDSKNEEDPEFTEGYDFELFDNKSCFDKSEIIEAFNPNVQVKLKNLQKF